MNSSLGKISRFFCLVSVFTAIFTSCAPSIVVNIKGDSAGTALFNAEMSAASENLVRRFTGTGGTGETGKNIPLFDKEKIIVSLARSGLKVDAISFPARTGLNIALSFVKLDGLLNQALILKKEAKTVSIVLSRESVNAALDLLPPDSRDYLALLMAPVFTGENRNRATYVADIKAAYGPTLADELSKSVFTLTLVCPSKIKEATVTLPGMTVVSESSAVFTIPLSALLAMENPFTARAEW